MASRLPENSESTVSRPSTSKSAYGQTFDAAKAEKILAFMGDGSPPFLGVAADRAGVNRKRAYYWVVQGESDHPSDPRTVAFAEEIRRLRGEYMALWSKKITEAGKDDRNWAFHASWVLQRLDRDLFDPPKQVVEKKTSAADEAARMPTPASPEAAQAASDDLEIPEADTLN